MKLPKVDIKDLRRISEGRVIKIEKGKNKMKRKLTWYLKQLLPLVYWTTYGGKDDKKEFCIWKMWLGKCYSITTFKIDDCTKNYTKKY